MKKKAGSRKSGTFVIFFLIIILPFCLRLGELQRHTRLAYSGKVQSWVITYSFNCGINHGINLFISPFSRIAGAPNASPRCNRHLDATAATILRRKSKLWKGHWGSFHPQLEKPCMTSESVDLHSWYSGLKLHEIGAEMRIFVRTECEARPQLVFDLRILGELVQSFRGFPKK